MNPFDEAFKHTLGYEGGYVNDPDDAGGETKFGISKRYYPEVNIFELTIDSAKEIYRIDYWSTKKLPLSMIVSVSSPAVGIELFDTAVNMGVPTATRMLQETLNLLRYGKKPLVVDGYSGKNTLEALSKADAKEVVKTLNGLQFVKYVAIVKADETQAKFFRGWLKRV